MSSPTRFTGPDLAPLLRTVRDELGEHAVIHEANRVERRGLRGVFGRDHFEVWASPPSLSEGPTAFDDDLLGDSVDPQLVWELTSAMHAERTPRYYRDDEIATDAPLEAARPGRVIVHGATPVRPSAAPVRQPRDSAGPSENAGSGDIAASTTITPPSTIDEPSTIAEPIGIVRRGPVPKGVSAAAYPPPPPPSVAQCRAAATRHQATVPAPPHQTVGPSELPEQFWSELAQLETMVGQRISRHANIQLIVGPLDVAMPLVRRLMNADGPYELAVLSDEIDIAGVSRAQLAESSRDLIRRLAHWQRTAQRGLAVIEASTAQWDSHDYLPPRLLHVIDRIVATHTVDLIRIGCRVLPPVGPLSATLDSIASPCVIDVAHPPAAQHLEHAARQGLNVATICGRDVTAELVMALRAAQRQPEMIRVG